MEVMERLENNRVPRIMIRIKMKNAGFESWQGRCKREVVVQCKERIKVT